METITLNNGVDMPALGLGVFQTPPDENRAAVKAALGAGYHHVQIRASSHLAGPDQYVYAVDVFIVRGNLIERLDIYYR